MRGSHTWCHPVGDVLHLTADMLICITASCFQLAALVIGRRRAVAVMAACRHQSLAAGAVPLTEEASCSHARESLQLGDMLLQVSGDPGHGCKV